MTGADPADLTSELDITPDEADLLNRYGFDLNSVGFVRGDAGLAEFTDEAVIDTSVLELASRVSYEIDPNDEYPRNYTGYIAATLSDGTTVEEAQPFLRGGSHDPMSRDELVAKCAANIAYGGVEPDVAGTIAEFADSLCSTRASDTVDIALAKALAKL